MTPSILGEMFGKRGLQVALVTAVLYAVLLIPFKQFVIVDAITEIRPAGAVPVAMAILFGPGAALGSAVGNLIGDILGGTLTMGSIGGFIGNFTLAFVAWLVWDELGSGSKYRFDLRSAGHYLIAVIVSSVACAVIIAVGLEMFGLVDLVTAFGIISLNNLVWTCTLGTAVVWLAYPRLARYRSDRAAGAR
jgi:energy-coupling factor transport system substrate-specific component